MHQNLFRKWMEKRKWLIVCVINIKLGALRIFLWNKKIDIENISNIGFQ